MMRRRRLTFALAIMLGICVIFQVLYIYKQSVKMSNKLTVPEINQFS